MMALEDEIRAQRLGLDRNLRDLQDRVDAALDWREQYARHTGWVLGATAVAAAALAASSAGRRPPRDRRSVIGRLDPQGRVGSQVSDFVTDVAAALVGVAGTAAVAALSRWVPGLGDEFDRRSTRR